MWIKLFIWITIIGLVHSHTEFDRLVEKFWEWRLQDNPEFASNIGDHRFTDLLEDYSIGAIDTRKVTLNEYLKELNAIRRDNLEAVERVSYDVLNDTIKAWLDGYTWRDYGPMNPVSFLEGIQGSYSSRAGQVQFQTEDDFVKFAARIRQYGVQTEQTIERMQKAIQKNTTYHSVSVVPEGLDEMLAYQNNVTSFPMYSPYMAALDEKVQNATAKEEIRNLAKQNIGFLLNKVQDLKTFVVNDYIPNTRATLGVYGLPDGLKYYQAALKWQLSTDITADEIHQTGLREVERINKELTKIVKRAKFQGTNKEYFDLIRQDSTLFISDPVEALQTFKDVYKERIVPKLNKFFKDIPDIPLVIEAMPNNGPSGIYKNGAPDGSRPGIFYANVNDPVPKFDMLALLLHETDPGHHLQDAYALSSPNLPMFRRATDFSKYFASPMHFPFYTAYSEGWGLYSEDLGTEMDVFENDLERLGKYGLEIFRAARLVVDTGIHAKEWSRDRAIEYMLNYTAYTEAFITREIDRYATWPGQACSYMIGKLKIRELRHRAVSKLCNAYHIKDFHSVVLTNGAMPLWVMENVVDEWIEKTRQENNIEGECTYTSGSGVFSAMAALNIVTLVLMFYSYNQN